VELWAEVQVKQRVPHSRVQAQPYGCYDFTVKAEGSTTECRFAGHVKTGRSSFSDPLMGGVLAVEKA
jgi:hypothetical protein